MVAELAGFQGTVFLSREGRRQGFLLCYNVGKYYQSFESKIPGSSPEKILRLSQEQGSVAEILWLKLRRQNVIPHKFPMVKGARTITSNQYDD